MHNSILLIKLDALLLIEPHSCRVMFRVNPNPSVGIDDAVKGDRLCSLLPSLAEDTSDTARGHSPATRGPSDAAIGGYFTRGNRESKLYYSLVESDHEG